MRFDKFPFKIFSGIGSSRFISDKDSKNLLGFRIEFQIGFLIGLPIKITAGVSR